MRPLILLALVSIACASRPPIDDDDDDDTTGEGEGEDFPPMPPLPETLRLQGDASGTVGVEAASCTFFADLGEVRAPEDGSVGFDALILGGEVFRRVEPADGKGTGAEFQALIGGPVTLRRTADGDVLRFVGDQTDAPRFWRALEVLTTEHAIDEASWSDSWSCEPIDVDEPGFVDNTTIVEGTWSMATLL